LSKLEPYHQS